MFLKKTHKSRSFAANFYADFSSLSKSRVYVKMVSMLLLGLETYRNFGKILKNSRNVAKNRKKAKKPMKHRETSLIRCFAQFDRGPQKSVQIKTFVYGRCAKICGKTDKIFNKNHPKKAVTFQQNTNWTNSGCFIN